MRLLLDINFLNLSLSIPHFSTIYLQYMLLMLSFYFLHITKDTKSVYFFNISSYIVHGFLKCNLFVQMWKELLNTPVKGFALETLQPMVLSLRVGAGRVPAALFPLADLSSQWAQRVRQGAPTETTPPMSSTASSALSAFTHPHRLHLHPQPTRWPMDQAPQSQPSD